MSVEIRQVRRGKRLYGGLVTTASGKRAYLAYRRVAEIFRSGAPDISTAIRTGQACWAIDEETLLQMRAQGVPFIGVLLRETGDIFLTRTEVFFDRTKAKILTFERRGAALQRYLPLQYFQRKAGKVSM